MIPRLSVACTAGEEGIDVGVVTLVRNADLYFGADIRRRLGARFGSAIGFHSLFQYCHGLVRFVEGEFAFDLNWFYWDFAQSPGCFRHSKGSL